MTTMQQLRRGALTGLLLTTSLLAPAPAAAADYVQATGSSLVFAGKYQDEVFVGRFPSFSTTLSFDPERPETARLHVVIPLADATTGNADFDGEMRGTAFFDASRFPQAQYHADGFRQLPDGGYAADGTLSLHGVDKPVTLTFTWTPGKQPVLEGKATVQRLDFGVGDGDWADTGLIPDAIAVSTKVVLRPAP